MIARRPPIATPDPTPHPIDIHVGARIRLRRKMTDVTQAELAEKLGLTFQQVQKYERGANRVSASKLYEIATALGAPISYFFEGLPDPESADGRADLPAPIGPAFLMTNEGWQLAELFAQIPQTKMRRAVISLVRSLAGAD